MEYSTDFREKLINILARIEGIQYLINSRFAYCAFWVYDKHEFNKWIDSTFFNPENIIGYATREQSAIGLHGINTLWYKATVFPYINYNLHPKCKIHHMSNDYIHKVDTLHGKIPFKSCINFV